MKKRGESVSAIKRQIRDYQIDPQKETGKLDVQITTARELGDAE